MKNLDPQRARWIRIRMGILCGMMGLGLGVIVSARVTISCPVLRLRVPKKLAWARPGSQRTVKACPRGAHTAIVLACR